MQPEATFITGYAAALLTATVGIHKLGRAKLSRPASQVRSGRRPPPDDEPGQEPDWPHSEVPRFYTRISLVAAGAAALLPGAELVARDNGLLEAAALIVVLVAALLTISWLGISTASGRLNLFARQPAPVGNRSPTRPEAGRTGHDDQHGGDRVRGRRLPPRPFRGQREQKLGDFGDGDPTG